ncbi:1-phosphofructokinase family hexose kinase [Methylotuvimicrobium sp.]|uniref:1-phosphofructokinase family hexose kinase n=1 Tax=Methylotuvimicrobium sp. TaxID=2822413 RepID=UPI003D64C67B
MAKIITVTVNTAIDLLLEVESFVPGETLSAERAEEFASGKGINVAKAIESLGHAVLCLGFAGARSIDAFHALQTERFNTDLTKVSGKTRTNITLHDSASGRETHIRTAGFRVTHDDCRRLCENVESHAVPGAIVIISGRLPPGAPDDFYRHLIEVCRERGVTTFLDASGPGLSRGIEAKPDVIKPNQQELEALLGKPLPDERSIAEAARELVGQGIQRVYVSRGEHGCIAAYENMTISAYFNTAPEQIVSRVGCGDALVAGLAVAAWRGLDAEAALKLGVACGTANMFSPEPGRFEPTRVNDITSRIVVEDILTLNSEVRPRKSRN